MEEVVEVGSPLEIDYIGGGGRIPLEINCIDVEVGSPSCVFVHQSLTNSVNEPFNANSHPF